VRSHFEPMEFFISSSVSVHGEATIAVAGIHCSLLVVSSSPLEPPFHFVWGQ
jgi:hypothetical protein